MSKNLLVQENGRKVKDTLKLVWPHKQKGIVPVQTKLPLTTQENDHPSIEV